MTWYAGANQNEHQASSASTDLMRYNGSSTTDLMRYKQSILAAWRLLSRVGRATSLDTSDWPLSNLMVRELSDSNEVLLLDWD